MPAASRVSPNDQEGHEASTVERVLEHGVAHDLARSPGDPASAGLHAPRMVAARAGSNPTRGSARTIASKSAVVATRISRPRSPKILADINPQPLAAH